jgi:hypothetical protein
MIRSGLGAQIGVATEEEYGKYKAPTRFFPFETESLSLSKNYIKSAGLRGGRTAQAQNLHRATTRSVAGDFALELFDQGMGMLFNQVHGNTVTPTKIEEKSKKLYKQLHEIGLTDPYSKSLTVQVGRPDTGGTVRAFSYLGCKVTELKITIESGGLAMVSVSIDGKDETVAEALGAATYDSDTLPYTFQQMAVKLGGATAANMRSVTLTIAVGQNTDRYLLGNSGTKSTPIVNALLAVTADASLEFASLADHARFTEEKVVELAIEGKGAEVEAGKEDFFAAKFIAPAAKQVGDSPTVQGPDIITTDVSFECLDNYEKAPLSVELLSTDSTI